MKHESFSPALWNLFNTDSRRKYSTQDPIFQSVESQDPTYEIPRVNPDWFMYPLVVRSHLACTWTTVAIPSGVVLWYSPGGNFTGNAPYIYHRTTLNHVQVIHFTEIMEMAIHGERTEYRFLSLKCFMQNCYVTYIKSTITAFTES